MAYPVSDAAGKLILRQSGSNRIAEVDADATFKRALIAFKPALAKEEGGEVEHLYLDTASPPCVTIGVGNMLPTAASAAALPLKVKASGKDASEKEKKDEWTKVSGLEQKNYSAKWYKKHTTLVLPLDEINALFDRRLDEFLAQLRKSLTDFNQFPIPARFALLDMAFNVGTAKLMNGFPRFIEAVKAKDWKTAAVRCKRQGISEERNKRTQALFEAAAAVSKAGDGKGVL